MPKKKFALKMGGKTITIINSFGHFSGVLTRIKQNQMNNRKVRKTSKAQEPQALDRLWELMS